jgi:hypothetical protein
LGFGKGRATRQRTQTKAKEITNNKLNSQGFHGIKAGAVTAIQPMLLISNICVRAQLFHDGAKNMNGFIHYFF